MEEYVQNLERLYKMMEQSLKSEEKITLKPPIVSTMNKKTYWSNFKEMCDTIRRSDEHFIKYLESEFNCNANMDSNDVLIIESICKTKHIESLIRRYINDYVRCNSCKSVNTDFVKEDRIYYVKCNKCRSQRKINNVQKGFQSMTKMVRKQNREN